MVKAPKPKNIMAALFGNPMAMAKGPAIPKPNINFDEAHYNKFERETKKAKTGTSNPNENKSALVRRKRQNPLGDFRFVKINELF
jgi:hypothetical protein